MLILSDHSPADFLRSEISPSVNFLSSNGGPMSWWRVWGYPTLSKENTMYHPWTRRDWRVVNVASWMVFVSCVFHSSGDPAVWAKGLLQSANHHWWLSHSSERSSQFGWWHSLWKNKECPKPPTRSNKDDLGSFTVLPNSGQLVPEI